MGKMGYNLLGRFKRCYKANRTVADFLDLKALIKYSQVCKSFYWVSGRLEVLSKFTKIAETPYLK